MHFCYSLYQLTAIGPPPQLLYDSVEMIVCYLNNLPQLIYVVPVIWKLCHPCHTQLS